MTELSRPSGRLMRPAPFENIKNLGFEARFAAAVAFRSVNGLHRVILRKIKGVGASMTENTKLNAALVGTVKSAQALQMVNDQEAAFVHCSLWKSPSVRPQL